MKKSNVAKVILVILIGIMLLTIRTTCVYAADSDNSAYQDLANALNSSEDDSDDSDSDSDDEENSTNETSNNSTGNNTLNTSSLRNTSNMANRANTTATSNVYNNTNLPKTGISDSVPVVVLIVIFGISATYAYKKVKDYRSL